MEFTNIFLIKYFLKATGSRPTYFKRSHQHIPIKYLLEIWVLDQHMSRGFVNTFLIKSVSKAIGFKPTYFKRIY